MRLILNLLVVCVAGGLLSPARSATAGEAETKQAKQFLLNPIGVVQRDSDKKTATLVINKDIAPALLGLDGYSHVWVLYWFDRNDAPKWRSILQLHPRGDKKNPLTGVFACRSPLRPNLIAMSLCRIRSVKDNRIEVEKIDAFDKTPILDLKPYLPGYDTTDGATVPDWVKKMHEKK